MDIYFNELSLEDRKTLEYDNVSEIAKIYKELGKHKIKSCRIDDASYISLLKLIENMPSSGNAKNFYFAFFHRPYETQEVLEREDEYYSHQYTFEGKDCYGLALGYVMDSISLSLEGQHWNDPIVVIKMDDSDAEVRHISRIEHIRWHKKWLEDQEEIVLVERSGKAVVWTQTPMLGH